MFLNYRMDEKVVPRNPLKDVVSVLDGPTPDVFFRCQDGYLATLSALRAFEIRM